ncbi:hypothetical protein GN157_15075 [Flavobacterium rakeshii]|uniref:DUF262 domain-containing protein n=1 Tax=Flavobacterium rakeshii TaxID=1038845 RepID=A0A6N8HH97_9FLAO|nr:hypothetical protein [Flavobacterium rakeshii]MUV05038.1 hypothetical protein [Flavobacterium rakeshii]
MKIEILDSKRIENRTWYLCKGNLLDYLNELKEDFYEYAIQRKIVKNQYLDSLYSTIKTGEPIPTITLTYNELTIDNIDDNRGVLDLSKSEILDGLQRSFRLWSYLKISNYYGQFKDDISNYRDFAKKVKDLNPLFFKSGVISTRLLKTIIENKEIENIKGVFDQSSIYITIWAGLTENEIIKKMLVLNAGQKSVSKTHQFELLFLHFFNAIERAGIGIKLFREKDKRANDIKKGKREIGEFMFSSVIVSLQSFVEERPLRVSTENLIDNDVQEVETDQSIYDLVFNTRYLIFFLSKLIKLDELIFEMNGDDGKEWFSKDTTLSGVFAALGQYINLSQIVDERELKERTGFVFDKFESVISNQGLSLNDFKQEYNVLSSRSVNIGTFIRKTVMEFVIVLLNEGEPTWSQIFEKVKNK